VVIIANLIAACDVRRTPACAAQAARLELPAVPVTDLAEVGAVVARLRDRAVATGWTSERHDGRQDGRARHVCPACTRLRAETGYAGIGLPPPPTADGERSFSFR
jgi:hypothetical protein